MNDLVQGPRQIRPEQYDLLRGYDIGANVLAAERSNIRETVIVLGMLNAEEGTQPFLEAAARVATDEDTPALQAAELLPVIRSAVEPFRPKQTDPTVAANVRWTMDWKGVQKEINARIATDPAIEQKITDWFLTTGDSFVKTTYAPAKSRRPLYVLPGGANDQCNHRPFLGLASMASPEFREQKGLNTLPEHTLNGEDAREAGWLKDTVLQAEVRQHVAERISAGEIAPRILVIGSADKKRAFPEIYGEDGTAKGELAVVKKYFSENTQPLYPDRGFTEADAQLAGALRVFGGDHSTIKIKEIPSSDDGELPAKRITFDSEVGQVVVLATVGSEATILGQVKKAHADMPELFDHIDGLYAPTTAIYTRGQQVVLQEAAADCGIKDIPIATLGLSAHAAGLKRQLPALVGELPLYLAAVHAVAERTVAHAEKYTIGDLGLLGELALR